MSGPVEPHDQCPAPGDATTAPMAGGNALPCVYFDSNDIEPDLRLDALNQFYHGLCDVQGATGTPGTIGFHGRFWRVGDIIAARAARRAMVIRFSSKKRYDDYFVVRMNIKGVTQGIIDGASVRMMPGDVLGYDRAQLAHSTPGDVETVNAGVPYATIGYDPSRHVSHLALAANTPLGRILRTNLETMLDVLPTTARDEVSAVSDGFTALLRAIVARDLRDEHARHHFERGRELALKRYIAEHLRDPDLGIAQICKAIGVARSTLYRIFEADGGVAHYVLRRRLEGAMIELARSTPRRGLVTAVALRWAFYDMAVFARQFRAQFGFSPRDVIGCVAFTSDDAGSASGAGETARCPDITPINNLMH